MKRTESKRKTGNGRRENIIYHFWGLRDKSFFVVASISELKILVGRAFSLAPKVRMIFERYLKTYLGRTLCHSVTQVKTSLGRAEFKRRERNGRRVYELFFVEFEKLFFLCVPGVLCVENFLGRALCHSVTQPNISGTRLSKPGTIATGFLIRKSLGRNKQASRLRSDKFSGTRFVSHCDIL